MKEKSAVTSVKKLKRSPDPLEGETVTLVLAETPWERACFAAQGRRQAAAHKDRELLQLLDISAA